MKSKPESFNRASFITLNKPRLFTAEQVADLIEQHRQEERYKVYDEYGILYGEDARRFYEYMDESDLRKQVQP